MPLNDQTGKTDHHSLPKEYFKAYRLEQAQQKAAKENIAKEMPSARGRERARARGKGKGKGKKRTGNSPGAGEPEASASVPPPSELVADAGKPESSASVPSPSELLASLRVLTLESGGSSATRTPSNSPSVCPPLSNHSASAPTKPTICIPARKSPTMAPVMAPTQNSTGFAAVSTTSNFLNTEDHCVLSSRTGAPPAGDACNNAARIATLEWRQDKLEILVRSIDLGQQKRQEELEELAHSMDLRLKKLGT